MSGEFWAESAPLMLELIAQADALDSHMREMLGNPEDIYEAAGRLRAIIEIANEALDAPSGSDHTLGTLRDWAQYNWRGV